jgi:hypothetical protein
MQRTCSGRCLLALRLGQEAAQGPLYTMTWQEIHHQYSTVHAARPHLLNCCDCQSSCSTRGGDQPTKHYLCPVSHERFRLSEFRRREVHLGHVAGEVGFCNYDLTVTWSISNRTQSLDVAPRLPERHRNSLIASAGAPSKWGARPLRRESHDQNIRVPGSA